MEKTKETKNEKIKSTTNKKSILKAFIASILKVNLAIAMLFLLAVIVNAGDVIVQNGRLNLESTFTSGGPTLTIMNSGGGDAAIDFKDSDAKIRSNIAFVSSGPPRFIINQGAGWDSLAPLNTVLNELGGNVGIGIINPNWKLDIAGDLNLQGPDSGNVASLNFKNTGTGAWWHVSHRGTTDNLEVHVRPTGVEQNANVPLTMTTSGRVGIGTAIPDGQLEIKSAGASTIPFKIERSSNTDSEVLIEMQGDNRPMVRIFQAGTEKIRLDPGDNSFFTNNVGIGTTNPAAGYKLDVEGNIQAKAFDTGDITFRDQETKQILWRMFEDEEGLYLENPKTGKVYRFVLEEISN